MKKYAVHGVVEVEVVKEVWANSEEEAYERAAHHLTYLTEYVGNGADDKLVGVEEDGESVFAYGHEIEYNDIKLLEDNPDYFECPDCNEECEVCESDDGFKYWYCANCDTYYDEDGDEFYPDVDEEEDE